MANTIKHQGIVENINGSHLQVRIIQTSACASCSVKGHCTSADTKEKLVDVADANAASYQPGDRVWVTGELSMGAFCAQKHCHSADLYHTELLNQVYHADGNL